MTADPIMTMFVLFLVAVVFYGPWQSLCTEFARQILIEERDAIFLRAASGDISFKSEEYKIIRSGFQSNIRFAHELTIPKMIYLVFSSKGSGLKETPSFYRAIDRIKNEELKSDIRKRVRRATAALLLMMMFKSSLFWILFVPVVLVLLILFSASKSSWRAACAVGKWLGGVVQVESEKNAKAAT